MVYSPPDPQARRQAITRLPAFLPGYPKQISGRTKAIHKLLSADVDDKGPDGILDSEPKEICNIYLDGLSSSEDHLDILSRATPERYRLLDCEEAVSKRTLRICEFSEFPRVQYAALSYVWRGNLPTPGYKLSEREFTIIGAEDADPIGSDVLIDACKASLLCGASYLWLDRLCIMQTSKQDKRWQIREMYRLYTFASVCIVAPGGLRFLVPLSEETQWIHRGWTLQEVVAPPSVAVLFSWPHGSGEAHVEVAGENNYGMIEVVTPFTSAMMGLAPMLGFCGVGDFDFSPDTVNEVQTSPLSLTAHLLGKPRPRPPRSESNDHDSVLLPHVAALGFATEPHLDTDEMRDFCIWQCALVRTSSRPVDMVFSVMGILGVILDPSDFDADDRLGATIALAREILRQGRSASWLGLSVFLPPSPYLSTFPKFPRTSVAGRAVYDSPSGGQETVALHEAVYPNDIGLFPNLKGSMDHAGYHSFDALAIRVYVYAAAETLALTAESPYDDVARPTRLKAVDGSLWAIYPDTQSSILESPSTSFPPHIHQSRSFAVMLGFYNEIPAETTGNRIRAMLVTEHREGQFHTRSYFLLNADALGWASTWKTYHFCVGGPETYVQTEESA